MRCRLLSYVLQLLLSKHSPSELKRLIWKKRNLQMRLQNFNGQGSIYLHPLNFCTFGILPGQIVYVYISYVTSQGISKHVERLFVARSLSTLSTNEFLLSDCDRINLFGYQDVVMTAELDRILPYPLSPISYNKLAKPETIRLAPIKQLSGKTSQLFGPSLLSLLNEPRIVYKYDVLILHSEHVLSGENSFQSVRVDFSGDSPCVLDSSCSLYETAAISAHVPFGGKGHPSFNLPNCWSKVVRRMRDLFMAFKSIHEQPLVLLLSGAPGSGKKLVVERFAALTNQNFLEFSCFDAWSEVSAQVEQKLKHIVDKAKSHQPCVLYISSVDILGFDPNGTEPDHRIISTFEQLLSNDANITVVIACNSDQVSNLPSAVRSLALYDLSVPFLDEPARLYLLEQHLPQDEATIAARNTSGFSLSELFSLIEDIQSSLQETPESVVARIETAVDKRNAEFADSIGAPKIPTVSWDDVGGLEDTKQIVIESIEANLHGDDNLRRSGIILFGPPGCGKTLIAKAVATEFKIAFLSVKGPELLNKYVGQSEENLRKVFERARQASPCVIFFDELDSLAPNRGRSGDSGGVMDRIVSQLLSEMDSLLSDPQCKVFVMAATNRADLLDPSLLTPGRFDKVVNVSPGSSVDTKAKILRAVCRKVKMNDDVDLAEAKHCPSVMSGAELYSVVSTATMAALREEVKKVDDGRIKISEAMVAVARKHLIAAVEDVRKRTSLN